MKELKQFHVGEIVPNLRGYGDIEILDIFISPTSKQILFSIRTEYMEVTILDESEMRTLI